ncbi:hypothetical protein H2241_21575 [Pantoea ananatis]|uniref:hypothetical protein n=1 Tax=Pantoea ananas TaxID=553 RepID=UPI00158A1A51|nr:hypothetical protein [Pantoea ananatis]MBA4823528.1 hypothetical protein [Pantoea ananatis]QKV85873.1 hypothetical protein FOB88_01325 [Pantoea ananatis]
MLTQQVIREEIEELKKLVANDELEIPHFWECAKPGFFIWLWLFVCPLIAFNMSGAILKDTVISVGFSSFLGFILFFWVINLSGYVLSIPRSFRRRSRVIVMLGKKIRNYLVAYMLIVLALAFIAAFSRVGALSYGVPLMFVTVFFAVIFNADISRYKLSALSEVIKFVSKRNESQV